MYPGKQWEYHSLDKWDKTKLREVEEFASKKKTFAYMIVQDGKIVDNYGDMTKKLLVHSIRKSFLSALYGINHERFDLSTTLEQLDIDDVEPSLTKSEKQATLLDLLRSRSGVYHPAAYETEGMKLSRPLRGSHPPGEFWYYNNW